MKDVTRFTGKQRAVARLFGLAAALIPAGCYDFHLEGPEDPSPVSPPRLVSVTVEYRQPQACLNPAGRCVDPVVFFGSWMRIGDGNLEGVNYVTLRQDAGGLIWRGTAPNVPVNFPPRDYPHTVRVFDPHILGNPTGGVTAERLKVGGELLTVFDSEGTPRESALVFIDENGFGHSP